MFLNFKNLSIMDISSKYYLLCNSRLLNVYYQNGDLINEFKVRNLSKALIYDDKVFISQISKKTVISIDIFTGIKKRISFKDEIDGILNLYKGLNDELIINAFIYITDEHQELKLQSTIITYNTRKDRYSVYTMKEHEFITNVLPYSNKKYIFNVSEKEDKNYKIYMLNKEKLEEYDNHCLRLKIEKFSISEDGKYFMVIDNKMFKVIDIKKNKEIFSYKYHDLMLTNLGDIFYVNNIPYVYIWDEFEHNICKSYDIDKLRTHSGKTRIYNLETGLLYKELDHMYKVHTITNHSFLYEKTKYSISTTRTNVFLYRGEDFLNAI